jgi:hypothetical protein
MTQNCWCSTATNGIYPPVYVVIVDDMKESKTTPVSIEGVSIAYIQLTKFGIYSNRIGHNYKSTTYKAVFGSSC